jgi:ppGpp synthetase/RelA/SpoT-type nucleotidyltranferase
LRRVGDQRRQNRICRFDTVYEGISGANVHHLPAKAPVTEHQASDRRTIGPVLPDLAAVMLSPGLIKIHEAYQQAVQENRSIWRPDSPAAQDVLAVPAADTEAMAKAYEYSTLLLTSAVDHLRAIADLVGHKHGFFPSISLARAVVEAAARAWYLLEPDIDCAERFRRYLNDQLFSLHEELWLLKAMEDEDAADRKAEIDGLLSTALRRGYPVLRGRNRATLGHRPTTSALIQELLSDSTGTKTGLLLYGVMSSVVHGAAHGFTKEVLESDEPAPIFWGSDIALLSAPLAFVQAALRALDQFGWARSHFETVVGCAFIVWDALAEGEQRRSTRDKSGVNTSPNDDATTVKTSASAPLPNSSRARPFGSRLVRPTPSWIPRRWRPRQGSKAAADSLMRCLARSVAAETWEAAALDLLDGFLDRYVKEYDYYDQVARRAEQILDSNLHTAGVRSIVTSRAKSPSRLEEKCRQRHKRRLYETIDEIYADIVDLAGVRVAVYFPAEREQVGGLISRLFHEYQPRRVFPDPSRTRGVERFSGYSADHYRVRLKASDLSESDQRYAFANIEIQVASVLMHAWSEVEHDLVYKPSEGELSEAEYSLLDQLNGLVLAGEISLEQLQKAAEVRVASGSRSFANHYELAAHLLSQVSVVNEGPVTDSGMGRVDLLFELLTRLGLNTPDDLRPYLEVLHGDLERRPLAEQIIDALIADNESRYETYRSVRAAVDSKIPTTPGEARQAEIGFLTQWVRLERLLGKLVSTDSRLTLVPSERTLDKLELLTPEMRFELVQLRRIRNELVHGIEKPSPSRLYEATKRCRQLIAQISRRRDEVS